MDDRMEGSGVLRLRRQDLHWQSVEGEVVVLDAAASQYLGINRAGADLWEALARGTTEEELARRLVERYQLTSDRARADVTDFVSALERNGLLERTQ